MYATDPGFRPSEGAPPILDRAARRRAPALRKRVAPREASASGRRPRIVLYSHDTMGLGHLRRNLLVAEELSQAPLGASILMIVGASEANLYPMPPGVDRLTLPGLHKAADGAYDSRHLSLGLDHLIAIRAGSIRAAMEAFEPDLFVVDNVPRGAVGELDRTLRDLRAQGGVRCVLGLRDVLDEPEAVRAEWRERGYEEAIRELYDEVWVYGDPDVYSIVDAYGLSDDIAEMVHYTGYLDRCGPAATSWLDESDPIRVEGIDINKPYVVCTVGGGQDGAALAETFARTHLPSGLTGVIVTGPFMPVETRASLMSIAESHTDLVVLSFVHEPNRLLANAEKVIAMGGYNTVMELLTLGKPSLIVPRVTPRREQLVRAQRFSELDLLDVCHPDELTPEVLSSWIASDSVGVSCDVRARVDFNGLSTIAERAAALTANHDRSVCQASRSAS